MANGGKVILVVEDHADSAAILQRLLELRGHTAVIAPTCAAALRMVREMRFELYIVDIGLPDGDGCDLLPKLRGGRIVPSIALTGLGMPDDVARGVKAGFASYLIKPVTVDKVEEAMTVAFAGALMPEEMPGNKAAPGAG